jgi:tetratricopeptide (TPR) repeat protein
MPLVGFGERFAGVTRLSQSKKPQQTEAPLSPHLGRRDFLKRSGLGAGLLFLPSRLRDFGLDSHFALTTSEVNFQLQPHYRHARPLDEVLLKVRAENDNFPSEIFAEQVGTVLDTWRESVLRSPAGTLAIEQCLAPGFRGSSLRASQIRPIRKGVVEVIEHEFAPDPVLGASAFVAEWRSFFQEFAKLQTADFYVTGIEVPSPTQIKTRVRYEFVGSGKTFHREQRVGYWHLDWQSTPKRELLVSSFRTLDETRSRSTAPMFSDITATALGSNRSYPEQLLHGSDYWRSVLDGASGIDIYGHNGVSVGDIDSDGFDDVYICQPAGLPNRLFRNRGDGTFDDITEGSGVGVLENTACALFIDTNNNGRQDLIVVRTNGPLLFLNQGSGKFVLQPDAFRFATPPQGTFTGAAAADYDRDGWLDIYFCLYAYYQGTEQYSYPIPYYDAQNGPANFLLRNNRDGTFSDVTEQSGLNQNNKRYSFCCAWADFDGDGWPDLYVVNDFGRKNLNRNNGNGTFTDIAHETGVEDVGAGMSVDWFDYNNDGAPDLYVANMWTAAGERISGQETFQPNAPQDVRALYQKHAMGNSLLRNHAGTFHDESSASGSGIGRWSWSSDSWDFDHDGYLDLYVTNGMVSGTSRDDLNSFFWRQVVAKSPTGASSSPDYEQGWNAINELIRADGTWSGYERNVFYANNRDGTFSDVSGAVDLDFIEDGRSFALADFDHDGRQELILKNRNSPQVRFLKNVIPDLPPSVSFCLRGTKSNRDAIGAVVTIETAAGHQTRILQAGSGFLSQHSKELFFGLGEMKLTVDASIRWPSGLVQRFSELPIHHRIFLEEGSGSVQVEPFTPTSNVRNASGSVPQPDVLPSTIETGLLVPIAAPEISLPDLSGKTLTFSSLRGKPLLLNFWISESPQCQKDLQLLQDRAPGWTAEGLQLLTVNFDAPKNPDSVRQLSRKERWSFPILLASQDTSAIYNLLFRYLFDRHRDLAFPTSFLIDSNGNIVKIYQGPLRADSLEHDFRHMPSSVAERIAKALPFPGATAPGFSRNYLSLGSVFFQQGYYEQAGALFQSALRDEPKSAEALYGIGSVQLKQDKLADAKDSFTQATRASASYPDTLPNAWNNLGIIATREHRMADAVQCFQEAVHINSGYLVALVNLGNAYRELEDWTSAQGPLQQAVQLAPEDPEANYSLGMVYAQTGDSERAREYLLKALQARPAYPEALNNLGILLVRTHHPDDAVARFEECIRVAPTFDQSYLNLARVYAIEGDREKARNTLLELLKQRPNHAQAKQMLQELK